MQGPKAAVPAVLLSRAAAMLSPEELEELEREAETFSLHLTVDAPHIMYIL